MVRTRRAAAEAGEVATGDFATPPDVKRRSRKQRTLNAVNQPSPLRQSAQPEPDEPPVNSIEKDESKETENGQKEVTKEQGSKQIQNESASPPVPKQGSTAVTPQSKPTRQDIANDTCTVSPDSSLSLPHTPSHTHVAAVDPPTTSANSSRVSSASSTRVAATAADADDTSSVLPDPSLPLGSTPYHSFVAAVDPPTSVANSGHISNASVVHTSAAFDADGSGTVNPDPDLLFGPPPHRTRSTAGNSPASSPFHSGHVSNASTTPLAAVLDAAVGSGATSPDPNLLFGPPPHQNRGASAHPPASSPMSSGHVSNASTSPMAAAFDADGSGTILPDLDLLFGTPPHRVPDATTHPPESSPIYRGNVSNASTSPTAADFDADGPNTILPDSNVLFGPTLHQDLGVAAHSSALSSLSSSSIISGHISNGPTTRTTSAFDADLSTTALHDSSPLSSPSPYHDCVAAVDPPASSVDSGHISNALARHIPSAVWDSGTQTVNSSDACCQYCGHLPVTDFAKLKARIAELEQQLAEYRQRDEQATTAADRTSTPTQPQTQDEPQDPTQDQTPDQTPDRLQDRLQAHVPPQTQTPRRIAQPRSFFSRVTTPFRNFFSPRNPPPTAPPAATIIIEATPPVQKRAPSPQTEAPAAKRLRITKAPLRSPTAVTTVGAFAATGLPSPSTMIRNLDNAPRGFMRPPYTVGRRRRIQTNWEEELRRQDGRRKGLVPAETQAETRKRQQRQIEYELCQQKYPVHNRARPAYCRWEDVIDPNDKYQHAPYHPQRRDILLSDPDYKNMLQNHKELTGRVMPGHVSPLPEQVNKASVTRKRAADDALDESLEASPAKKVRNSTSRSTATPARSNGNDPISFSSSPEVEGPGTAQKRGSPLFTGTPSHLSVSEVSVRDASDASDHQVYSAYHRARIPKHITNLKGTFCVPDDTLSDSSVSDEDVPTPKGPIPTSPQKPKSTMPSVPAITVSKPQAAETRTTSANDDEDDEVDDDAHQYSEGMNGLLGRLNKQGTPTHMIESLRTAFLGASNQADMMASISNTADALIETGAAISPAAASSLSKPADPSPPTVRAIIDAFLDQNATGEAKDFSRGSERRGEFTRHMLDAMNDDDLDDFVDRLLR